MTVKHENITTGLDRLNAWFAGWGVPTGNGGSAIDGQMKRFQAFASDLQKAYGETYSRQINALLTTNQRIAGSLQEFIHCRQPQDVIAAESTVLATMLEAASLQAETWIELAQKLQDCCAAMAREAAEDIHKQATETTPAASEHRAGKQERRQQAHA